MKRQGIIKLILLLIIAALSAAAQTPSKAPEKPLTRAQILALLGGDVPSSRVSMLVGQRGIDFTLNAVFLAQIQKAGGEDDLSKALLSAHVTNAASATPAPAAATTPPPQTPRALHRPRQPPVPASLRRPVSSPPRMLSRPIPNKRKPDKRSWRSTQPRVLSSFRTIATSRQRRSIARRCSWTR